MLISFTSQTREIEGKAVWEECVFVDIALHIGSTYSKKAHSSSVADCVTFSPKGI